MMRWLPRVLSAGLAAAAVQVAAYGHGRTGEQLIMPTPSGFTLGDDLSRDGNLYDEFVPAGQSVDEWTDMITVQEFRHSPLTAAMFLQRVGALTMRACPGTTSRRNILTGTVNGYTVSMLDLECPDNPRTGKPETVLFRAIRGQDALYAVQYAWRSVPSVQQLQSALRILGATAVCDTRSSEHPCPPQVMQENAR